MALIPDAEIARLNRALLGAPVAILEATHPFADSTLRVSEYQVPGAEVPAVVRDRVETTIAVTWAKLTARSARVRVIFADAIASSGAGPGESPRYGFSARDVLTLAAPILVREPWPRWPPEARVAFVTAFYVAPLIDEEVRRTPGETGDGTVLDPWHEAADLIRAMYAENSATLLGDLARYEPEAVARVRDRWRSEGREHHSQSHYERFMRVVVARAATDAETDGA